MTASKKRFGLDARVVEKINAVFKKYSIIEKVILYGSRAKGNFKPASDIDLTIITSEESLSFLFKV